jgi:hypothetical protein
MRILFLVLLSIVVLVGVFLGGSGAWSATKGPMAEKMAKLAESAAAAKEMGKLTGNSAIVAGKTAGEASGLLEQGLRGYKVIQFGGAAIALINVALLVLAIKRHAKGIMIVGGLGVVLGIVCFVLSPPKQIDDTMHMIISILGGSVILAALFAFLAGRSKAAAAPALR